MNEPIKKIQAEQKVQNQDIAKLETKLDASPAMEGRSHVEATVQQEASLQSAGVREAGVLAAQGQRDEAALTKVSQRRINFIWEITQAILAVMVPGVGLGACVFLIASPSAPPELKTAAFVAMTGTMSSVTAIYFQRTNHTRVGGVQIEHRGE